MMAEKIFYIRHKGQDSGPFPVSHLHRLWDKRLLSPEILISEDRISWLTYPEVFQQTQEQQIFEPAEGPMVISIESELEPKPEPESVPETIPFSLSESVNVPVVPEPVERLVPQSVIPDPVCATIGLIWNARKQLLNLNTMQQLSVKEHTESADRNLFYSFGTAAALIFLQFLTAFVCTFILTRSQCTPLMMTALIVFPVCVILLLLENLLFAVFAKLQSILAPFFLIMQLVNGATIVFCAGLPLFALYCVGMEQCATWAKWLAYLFSGLVLTGEVVNHAFGYIAGCRKILGFSKGASVALYLFFTLQWLAVFPAGYFLFELIQKK